MTAVLRMIRTGAIAGLFAVCAAIAGPRTKDASDTMAMLHLRSVPKSATVSINDIPVVRSLSAPIQVAPGNIQLKVSSDGTQMVKSFVVRAGDAKILNFGANPDFAAVDIITDPLGAEAYIDDVKKGETPFIDTLVEPGFHHLAIRKYGYDPIERAVTLIPQEELELTFELKRSKAWTDSVARAKIVKRQKRRFVQRIAYTVLGTACGGAVLYFDDAARRDIASADELAQRYDSAREGFDELRTGYYEKRSAATSNIRYRDISAGLAGVMAFGFLLTFVF